MTIELIGMSSGKFDVFKMIADKRERFENLADYKGDALGSRISLPKFNDAPTMLKAGPEAILTVLTRPGIQEANNLLVTFAAAENILIILLFAAGLIYFKKYEFRANLNLILMLLFFSLSVIALIGLTTPVMGTIVRHKSPVMPFLCLIPMLISAEYDRNRKKNTQLTQ